MREAGRPLGSMKQTRSLVIPMMSLKLTRPKTGQLKSTNPKLLENILIMLIISLIISQIQHITTRNVFFETQATMVQPLPLEEGIKAATMVSAATATAAATEAPRRDHVSPAVHSSTGGESAHKTPSQLATEGNSSDEAFIKDEYCTEQLTNDYFEYEQGQGDILVKHRLKDNYEFWAKIGASEFVLDIIKRGYKLPFFATPESVFLKNNKSAIQASSFVSEAINDLLARSLIDKCDFKPIVVNPLTVATNSSNKKRLILDLRHVNKHLWKSSIKFDDIKTAMQFIEQGSYCFKFDIHSAYHHVDIFVPHTEYLGFSWTVDNVTTFYKFNVLPFGLSSACYICVYKNNSTFN